MIDRACGLFRLYQCPRRIHRVPERVFLDDAFRAIKSTIGDLRILLADCGRVACFSCLLDDVGEWNGQPIAWIDCRWTGVLEKKDGRWVIMQMHFSLPSDGERST